ncbi:MAG: IS110 family transposase [Dehalococcoidia bacterium]
MQVVYERCCGLDVHKDTVVACVITPEGKSLRTFGTMTRGLMELADWLAEKGVTHVAMESTGVYWKAPYNLLESFEFTLLVVNARDMKAVPGRKTDMKDAEWIADLLRHGLLKASYIPSKEQRELRELVRYRRTLIRERSQVINRIQKVLEGAGIKLSSVVSDVLGMSGRAMIEAMVAGEEDPEVLAGLSRGRLRAKQATLEEALRGQVGQHQRLVLDSLLRHVDFLDKEIARMDEDVSNRLGSSDDVIRRLDEIPGIGRRTAEDIIAEIGLDMSRFPTSAHLASWARVCPGNNESAGKRRDGSTGSGNPWLQQALVEAAWAASRTKKSYFSALFHRLAGRRGAKRAIVAVAHAILVVIYHMILKGTAYSDLGANYFDERNRQSVVKRAVRRIESLGYKVSLEVA